MSQVSYGTITITDVSSSGGAPNQHFWFNPTTLGTLESGAYITNTAIDTFKSGKDGGYLLARSDKVELGQGNNKFITLSGSALNFYRPGTSIVDASLASNGLVLSKGGIEIGDIDPGQNGFIYLSTEDYPLREYELTTDVAIDNEKIYYEYDNINNQYIEVETPDIININSYYEKIEDGITINGYTPNKADINLQTTDDPAWRQIIGSKFGVDAEGNLYASGVNVSGTINATSGMIGGCTIDNEGHLMVPSAQIIGTLTADRIVFQNSTVEDQLDTLQYAIQIDSENASIIMGDENSFHIKIIGDSNNSDYGLGFYYGTTKVSYMSDQRLNIPYSVVLKEMQLSDKWSWTQKESGNMTLVWIGEATS